jgi:hypothetical protein
MVAPRLPGDIGDVSTSYGAMGHEPCTFCVYTRPQEKLEGMQEMGVPFELFLPMCYV